ncbi:hypothetical protein K432DRAFT_445706 [Lepidopterella palustris CBS 459.81]|uniref:DUF1989 domain-containing protein n=1 Tax=Lepidopterella palustris CBS 459.81 TaxID=1314670 RepID=A0A8E2E464_9PEZI|nr:hypothetical protein K432DRAFT_445706 [Lepidopterella palustris CBS 459.81]
MSGELQTIPARHGVATFVPRGRTIKIINTYGKQVVSTWAFALHQPPEKKEVQEAKEVEMAREKEKVEEAGVKGEDVKSGAEEKEDVEVETAKVEKEIEKPKEEAQDTIEDPPEEAPGDATKAAEETTSKTTETVEKATPRTWASYLPSLPYRSNPATPKPPKESAAEKSASEATSRKWSSYIPTGKGFSSYVPNVNMPNVQVPSSKVVMSAFASSHYRDPNKSYAEQLYDFSKTPVGAGGLAELITLTLSTTAATGSGTASSLYAAYSAYTKLQPSSSLPPMEYLSLPHTRASSHRLVPQPTDTLLTNLRAPILTLVEDTTPGAHDTLTAACDASMYAALSVDKPEEHGSCAENLVLALKELNEKAGLKGEKAVGADVTVNIAPTPLHLFMNAPVEVEEGDEGAGAKGVKFRVEEPRGKKRGFVRFRAERDVVVVMSACPMDVGSQNGGKCMAANFVVEDEEDEGEGVSGEKGAGKGNGKGDVEKKKEEPAPGTPMPKPKGGPMKYKNLPKVREKTNTEPKKEGEESEPGTPMPKPKGGPVKFQKPPAEQDAATAEQDAGKEDLSVKESPMPKKKPKKLEKRSA